MRRYFINVKKNTLGAYYWVLRSSNGRTLAHSEDYSNKTMCIRTASKLQGDLDSGYARCKLREV